MRRRVKTTRRVRIRLDFVVECAEDLTAPPFDVAEAAGAAISGVARGLKKHGVVSVYVPNMMGVSLDFCRPKVTPEERALMRRMLGLDRAKVAYRNRYAAPKDAVPPMLEDLARRGLVDRGKVDTYAWFHVSWLGIEVSTLPREREKPEAPDAGRSS